MVLADTINAAHVPSQAFQETYAVWTKGIQDPAIALSSSNDVYQNIPEYRAIIDLGESAINDIYFIMKSDEGMSHMLFLAVIEIKGWNIDDFGQYQNN